MVELNPEHPVTMQLHDYWHVLCFALLVKLNAGQEVVITKDDTAVIKKWGENIIVVHDKADGVHLKIVTLEEARRLAKQVESQGGIAL